MQTMTLRLFVIFSVLTCVPQVFGATIVNPPNINFSGIISEVRLDDVDAGGGVVQRTLSVTTSGAFNTLSGGFAPISPDTFVGTTGFPFVGDTRLLTGIPDASTVDPLSTPNFLLVGAGAYSTDFATGDLGLAQLTLTNGGGFEIGFSDQESDSLILINAAGDIVGRLSGSYPVPEPSSLVLVVPSGLLLLARRRIRMS